jgi:hypothetical protein
MPTDDDLTTLLRRGFTQATADLEPEPDLAHVVRRRHVRARRRRLVVGVAVPAAALAASSGLALAGQDSPNQTPTRTAVAVAPPSAPASTARTASVTSVPMKPASYKVVAIKNHSAPPNCPANATAPVGKSENPAGVWYWTEEGTCIFVGIGWADTKPANAVPVHIKGYPGLYGTLKPGVRTIYAPVAPGTDSAHPRGGWVALTLSANASDETVVRLIIVPAN